VTSVCVVGLAADRWGATAALATLSAGATPRLIAVCRGRGSASEAESAVAIDKVAIVADASDTGVTLAGAILPGMRAVLAAAEVPLALIGAAFSSPSGRTARKIVDVANGGAASLRLFDVADMLIFTPAAIAGALDLPVEPHDTSALAAVRKLLVRPNQAAVIRFPGRGAAALWADRTTFVASADAGDHADAAARFSGTIAAAVAQGIGPEPALVAAMVAAASH
jgi:hypothetical protein